MGKELLLLGLGAAAVGVYLLSTSGTSSAVSGNVDAAGSFPQYPQVGGSQYGGVSTPAGSTTTSLSNPVGAGSNRPSITDPVPSSPVLTSPNPATPVINFSDQYFYGWAKDRTKQEKDDFNAVRNELGSKKDSLSLIVADVLSGNGTTQEFGSLEGRERGRIKISDLYNAVQEKAMQAKLSVFDAQSILTAALRKIGVR